jgi:transcriptional regulator with XRE-family HTH domain
MDFRTETVGKVIRTLRKKKGMTQEVLSGLASIARSHLGMIETGKKQANFETIWRLAAALGMAPSELVRLIEESEEEPNSEPHC